MKNLHTHDAGFIRTEWVIVVVALALLISLLLRITTIWIESDCIVCAAVIFAALPVILIAGLLVVFLITRPFIDRRIAQEMKRAREAEERGQPPSPDNDVNHTAPKE